VHERDAREGLQRPVVEEQGEAPSLVLLRRDQLRGEVGPLGLAVRRLADEAGFRSSVSPFPGDRGSDGAGRGTEQEREGTAWFANR
jgi:hypothetical protein